MAYFIEHFGSTLALFLPLTLFLTASLAGGILVDVDHKGSPQVLLSCAVRNSSEACYREEIQRGITHSIKTYYLLTLGTITILTAWLSYTLHLVLDEILWW